MLSGSNVACTCLVDFGRNYDRKMELHLDDLDANQLMEKSRSAEAESDGGWRQEAFVKQLAALDQVDIIISLFCRRYMNMFQATYIYLGTWPNFLMLPPFSCAHRDYIPS